jgi:exopolyphosphatase/guanosine-5'-triphosphate,3'-diphosphate pyrophosphatase
MAAVVLRRLLRSISPRRVVFSANGLREGWYLSQVDEVVRQQDPLLEAGRGYAARLGRDAELPPVLITWTDPIFAGDTRENRRLREAACWMSDIASHDHPEFRAEQAFYRVLRQPGIGLDHHARAFLALTVAIRYDAEADAPYLAIARALLDVASMQRAERLGLALRLAYTLSAGTAELLTGTSIFMQPGRICLRLTAPAGDSALRRLERLGAMLGLEPALEEAR